MPNVLSRKGLVRQLVGLVVMAVVLWVNALAGSGRLSGESIGLIANRYRSTFLPADWVFGIWSLIYLWLVVFSVYQALPAQRDNETLRRLGWGWAVNGALNMAWVALFSFALFGPALAVMVALLVNLIWLVERTGWAEGSLSRGDRVFVAWPFGLYLAWIAVALIANTFQYMTFLEWDLLGLGAELWSAIMMVVATALSGFMALHRGNWLFPLVFAWAFVGIADRFSHVPLIASTAYTMTAVALGVLVLAVVRLRRPGRSSPASSRDPARGTPT